MVKRKASILLIASSLLVLPVAATAQSDKAGGVTTTTASKGGAVTAAALVERYGALAGSPDNAKSLVNGLRTKSEIVLTGPKIVSPDCKFRCGNGNETIRFTPKTEPMGWGNVDIALALLEADLKKKQVGTPKPQHIRAGLQGESVPAPKVTFEGILKLRSNGMGWGEIANLLEFQLQ
jgi:hypothetical protein